MRGANPAEWLALLAGVVPSRRRRGLGRDGPVRDPRRRRALPASRPGWRKHPATAAELAADLDLDPLPTRLLLDCLRSAGHVTVRAGRYQLSRSLPALARPGLRAVGRAVRRGHRRLLDLVGGTRRGDPRPPARRDHVHDAPPDDPYWRRYIRGQLRARPAERRGGGQEAAAAVGDPRSLLDIGGGHGWYSAQLCRRHPRLTATVLDLPGSAAIGREIIAAAGMADRVEHRDGDATAATGPGPGQWLRRGALLQPRAPPEPGPDPSACSARIHEALAPGGTLAVMDAFAEPSRRTSAAANFLGLFVYLSSGSQVHTPAQLHGWLREAGFGAPAPRSAFCASQGRPCTWSRSS